jgi:Isocitrate lyase family
MANKMANPAVDPNREEQQYLDEVAAVKQWWTDSRWRYTKRPFTAEQIVAKRGNLKIDYPSNVQSKKLWNILEGRFKVCLSSCDFLVPELIPIATEQGSQLHLRMPGTHHVNPNGEISRHRLRFRLAIIIYRLCIRRARSRFGRLPLRPSSSNSPNAKANIPRPPSQTKSPTSSWPSFSMTASNAKNV